MNIKNYQLIKSLEQKNDKTLTNHPRLCGTMVVDNSSSGMKSREIPYFK